MRLIAYGLGNQLMPCINQLVGTYMGLGRDQLMLVKS
jgi:hypothetical protein